MDARLELVDGVGKAMCGCWGTFGGSCLKGNVWMLGTAGGWCLKGNVWMLGYSWWLVLERQCVDAGVQPVIGV